MSLLTKIKLKENCDKSKANVNGIKGVGWIIHDPRKQDVDQSKRVTIEIRRCDKLELLVIWSMAPDSMTHLEKGEIRHMLVYLTWQA